MKFSDFIDKEIIPEQMSTYKPQISEIRNKINSSPKTIPSKFEKDVFNFLFQNKNELGIYKIYQLKNSSIDGLMTLDDGRSIAMEIKYRMGWEKACQANHQFEQFFRIAPEIVEKYNPQIGVVFFNEFSMDFKRRPKKYKNVYGWNYWYYYHNYLPGREDFKIHLIRFSDGKLSGYPSM